MWYGENENSTLFSKSISTSQILYHYKSNLSRVFLCFFIFLHFPLFYQTFSYKIVENSIFTKHRQCSIIISLQNPGERFINPMMQIRTRKGLGYWLRIVSCITYCSKLTITWGRGGFFVAITLTSFIHYDIILVVSFERKEYNNERKNSYK